MKQWTPREIRILRAEYPVWGGAMADKIPGRTTDAICRKVQRLGIKAPPSSWPISKREPLMCNNIMY